MSLAYLVPPQQQQTKCESVPTVPATLIAQKLITQYKHNFGHNVKKDLL